MAGKSANKPASSAALDASAHTVIRSIVAQSGEAKERLSEDDLGQIRKYLVANRVDDFLAEKSDVVYVTSYPVEVDKNCGLLMMRQVINGNVPVPV
jgi:hypothetical protein